MSNEPLTAESLSKMYHDPRQAQEWIEALVAQEVAKVAAWFPIEKALTDGRDYLARCNDEWTTVVYFEKELQRWCVSYFTTKPTVVNPTHVAYIPQPPQEVN